MAAFADKLEALVGAGRVDHRSVQIWARLHLPTVHELEIVQGQQTISRFSVRPASASSDGTGAWTYPDDVSGPELLPLTRYGVRLLCNGELVAEAAFQTAPSSAAAAPAHWSFAAMSCNQPFSEDGSLYPGGAAMFRAALASLHEHDARFALLMGDQMYADAPQPSSLFDKDYFARIAPAGLSSILECSRERVRMIYQERYRQAWSPAGFRALQAALACYPMLDDHEVVDNFGTDPEHALARWDALRHGALDAYFDYQGVRVTKPTPELHRPRELDYGFRWGGTSVYVMDVRSQRRTNDGVTECYTPVQLEALRVFLSEQADQPLLVLVTAIPLIYLDSKISGVVSAVLQEGSDLHERWSHPQCIAHRNRILSMLADHAQQHPQQLILLLGGDVHTAVAYELEFEGGRRMYQLVTSAISNHEGLLHRKLSELASQMIDEVEFEQGRVLKVRSLKPARAEAGANPYGGLNMGMVDVSTVGGVCSITLRVIGYRDGGEAVTVFESKPLFPSSAG